MRQVPHRVDEGVSDLLVAPGAVQRRVRGGDRCGGGGDGSGGRHYSGFKLYWVKHFLLPSPCLYCARCAVGTTSVSGILLPPFPTRRE